MRLLLATSDTLPTCLLGWQPADTLPTCVPAVPQGSFRVRLLLADMQSASKSSCTRALTITAEGQTVLQGFSVANRTSPLTATTILFVVPVSDGKLNLEIRGINGNAFLNGLIVEAVSCTHPLSSSPVLGPSPLRAGATSPPQLSPSAGTHALVLVGNVSECPNV